MVESEGFSHLYTTPIRFLSSSVKIPRSSIHHSFPIFDNLPFARQNFSSKLQKSIEIIQKFISSFASGKTTSCIYKSTLLCSSSLALVSDSNRGSGNSSEVRESQVSAVQSHQKVHLTGRHGKEDLERILISEVLVRNKDGEELENKDLAAEAAAALKACRPNSALTVQEVQEDVLRIIDSGYFQSCMPVAIDTRDGIRLIFQVEPNQEFQGLICEGANVLPARFLEDAFREVYGKVVNIRHLDGVIHSINGWYRERGLFGLVSDVDFLSGGIIRLKVTEAEVNNITIRFLDRKTGKPTTGKTRPETILQQLTTKKGQVYSLQQGKRDVETLLKMGIMEDVSIVPQPAGDIRKVDLIMNVVERVSGGFSAGGGISSGIGSGAPCQV